MNKWFFLFLGVAVLVLPGFSEAKEMEEMEEMVVTASRVKEPKKEITINVSVIDQDAIKTSSARNLGDLLAERAGINIRKYTGTLTSVGIRGFRTESHGNDLLGNVLILLDGRRAATGNVAKIMTRNIERVEIIRGPASVQYGSAAVGGVINVITKQGREEPEVFAEGGLGSFGYEEAAAGFSGKYNMFDFSGSFSRSSRDDYDTGDGDEYKNTGYDEIENISLNLGLEFLPGNRLGFIYTAFDADGVGSSGKLSENDLDDFKDSRNESIDFVYDGHTPSGLFSWMARYFQVDDDDKWVSGQESDPDGFDLWYPEPSKRNTDSEGAQGQISLNLKYSTLTAGFDWLNYDIKSSFSPNKSEYDNTAGFILGKTRLLDERLILTAGLRYDEYEVEIIDPAGRNEDDDNFSPSIGVAYLLNNHLKFRANYAEAFVMPAADQLAADYVSWTHFVGNPDLDPEESKTYEGGIDFSYAGFNSALTYFHTDFENKIETVYPSATEQTWENLGEATVSGFEGEISYDFGALFSWDVQVKPYLSFTYLTEYEDEETGEDLQYTPDLTASYGLTISQSDDFSANLNFAYFGEQDIEIWQGMTSIGSATKGGFTVANFTISKKILQTEKFGGLTLNGEIQNIFDKDYEYIDGFPMIGRSFFLGLRYDY